ncbi:MAG: carboxylesterase/lipase family protein, partial [Parasporobacterium sp.]|nr:carboxylesterase/lipase family protein [Parasporobacterium sp.]
MKKVVRTPDFPIVETKLGKLHGFLQDDVYHFHGIRYGTAERFELPVMEKPWEGVRDAKSYGYICPLLPEDRQAQTALVHDPSDRNNPFAHPFCSFEMPHVYWPMDEQCLYLNVWTKHLDQGAKKPVMVWLHGGGFGSGSAIELPSYDGTNFTDYGDVVFVSLNHRLNCIGFLDLSSFGESFRYSGIAGMADIVLALQWVHENIEAFGGDPDNVTVAGQSGGGGKAAMLLQMPAADGLYHKVISQSGALKRSRTKSVEEEKIYWQELGSKTAQILGLDETSIDRIRKIPYEELSAAASQAGRELGREGGMMLLNPSPVDDYYIGSFELAGFREETADIPVIAGTVLGEFNFMHYLGDKNRYSE